MSVERPWLITGCTGLLGSELLHQLAESRVPVWGAWHQRAPQPVGPHRYRQLDISDRTAVLAAIHDLHPALIIHTAYRKDGPQLQAITATGAGYIAEAAAAVDARLIHLSSDVLLDGEHAPYDENALPAPVHPYGVAKAAAEAAVQTAKPDAVLVRTSLISRLQPPDPVSAWIERSLRSSESITLFSDEIRCPVWVNDLAAALIELAALPYSGVLNIAGPQALSRYEMGRRLAARLDLPTTTLSSGSSLDSGLSRPRNCTLDTRRAQALLRTRLRSYDEGLAKA
ncbi:MAG: sugar nucleotide-binding protein [Caldilineales bacterium]